MQKMYYCERTKSFFDPRVHAEIPADALLLNNDEYNDKLAELSVGNNAPPALDSAGLLYVKLQQCYDNISILKPAVDGGYAKPEHPQLLADWQRYRYELTLVSEQPGWPEDPQWPTEPDKVI